MAKMGARLEDPSEAVTKLLTDFALDEADAKGGNMLLLSADGGKTVRLAPIDRSLGMMGWRNAVEPGKTSIVTGDWSLAGRLKVNDLRSYMKTRGSPKGMLELVQDLASQPGGRAMVEEAYDDAVRAMRAIDLDDVFRGLEGTHANEAKQLIEHRIAVLEKDRAKILKQMGVAEPKPPVVPAALDDVPVTGRSKVTVIEDPPTFVKEGVVYPWQESDDLALRLTDVWAPTAADDPGDHAEPAGWEGRLGRHRDPGAAAVPAHGARPLRDDVLRA
jgi:hypothetical protein